MNAETIQFVPVRMKAIAHLISTFLVLLLPFQEVSWADRQDTIDKTSGVGTTAEAAEDGHAGSWERAVDLYERGDLVEAASLFEELADEEISGRVTALHALHMLAQIAFVSHERPLNDPPPHRTLPIMQ